MLRLRNRKEVSKGPRLRTSLQQVASMPNGFGVYGEIVEGVPCAEWILVEST